jgi:hypothetical protein
MSHTPRSHFGSPGPGSAGGRAALLTRGVFPAGLLLLWCATAGCTVVQHESQQAESVLQSITTKGRASANTNVMTEVQLGVMRESDLYVAVVAQACEDFRARVPSTEARNMALQWKLTQATAAYVAATGERPFVNAVDMLVLATLSRQVIENYWVKEKFGDAARPLLEAHSRLETNAWTAVRMVLSPSQQEEIKDLLQQYSLRFPGLRNVAGARLPDIANAVGKLPAEVQRRDQPGSLFGLLYINPLAGLDPTTQAIQQTRMLAERAMYYAQRMPMLMSWQVELTVYQLAAQPESRQILGDVNDFAQSSTVFARTAEGLPQLVNDQREAAINQLLAGATVAGSNLLVSLSAEETKVRGLLAETRQALDAGTGMSTSLNTTLRTFDALMKRFGVGEPVTNSVPDTNSTPFNILDYAQTAERITTMAREVDLLLKDARATVDSPALIAAADRARTDARSILNYAFLLGLLLIVFAFACAFGYRRYAFGATRDSRPEPTAHDG